MLIKIIKKVQELQYNLRFTKAMIKHPHTQINWDKWIEREDENNALNQNSIGDWNPSNMQDLGMGDYEGSDVD